MDCAICGNKSGLEALCQAHRRMLATCTDLTPEQVRSRPAAAQVGFGLVDMFGVTHLLPDAARLGRDPETCDLAVLHASISSSHAQVAVSDHDVTVVDLGSLNGTFVDEQAVTRATFPLKDLHLRIGAVSFLLSPDARTALGGPSSARRTVPRGGGRTAMQVGAERWELSISSDAADLAGPRGRVDLSLMEGRLLRALIGRAGDGAFVTTAELVVDIGFGSRAADGDNVRELVRRLRRKLEAVGLGELVESRRNAGYRLVAQPA